MRIASLRLLVYRAVGESVTCGDSDIDSGISCCACAATNVEAILGLSIANREETVIGKPLHTVKIR